ncbi:MAG: hypothetical protein V1897_10295 [Pseudomonadota bacterium]
MAPRERLRLIGAVWLRMPRKTTRDPSLSTVTTVLLLLGPVRKRNRLFQVGGTNQWLLSGLQNLRNGKAAA